MGGGGADREWGPLLRAGPPWVAGLALAAGRAPFPIRPGFLAGQFLPSLPTGPEAAKALGPSG